MISKGDAVTSRELQVTAQVSRIEKGLTALRQSIINHEDRLTKVLRGPIPQPKGPEEEKQTLVPLAEILSSFSDSIDQCIWMIDDIDNRIEI